MGGPNVDGFSFLSFPFEGPLIWDYEASLLERSGSKCDGLVLVRLRLLVHLASNVAECHV